MQPTVLSKFVTSNNLYTPAYCLHSQQKNHTGVYGRTGPSVVRSVEVEFLTEEENVSHQNVHTLMLVTIGVMEVIMKRRNVMNSAVQVC